ncbi:DUF2218 domain-containing protein [Corynebacterium breve]|uniref:DUF2218 domain-containing protein n=1 Tax=Corynebacterium breve TaxID=3049799 RepID=A0ABY8VIG4_9CORY|nr:DUF2218 domain-containing protein [Corynebacterium breve]WIM68545.1 DUF2218 domain-containing protein [Corynebacterium breve]
MSETITSTARVRTDRPGRYGKQLASHFGKKIDSQWDAEAQRGHLTFPSNADDLPAVTCDMIAGDNVLMLSLDGETETVIRLERVVAVHLIRFGAKDALEVKWTRTGGEEAHFTIADVEQK